MMGLKVRQTEKLKSIFKCGTLFTYQSAQYCYSPWSNLQSCLAMLKEDPVIEIREYKENTAYNVYKGLENVWNTFE